MVVYLAGGPSIGTYLERNAWRDHATDRLEAAGMTTLNPLRIWRIEEDPPDVATLLDQMRRDLPQAQIVLLYPDPDNPLAAAEYHEAVRWRLPLLSAGPGGTRLDATLDFLATRYAETDADRFQISLQ